MFSFLISLFSDLSLSPKVAVFLAFSGSICTLILLMLFMHLFVRHHLTKGVESVLNRFSPKHQDFFKLAILRRVLLLVTPISYMLFSHFIIDGNTNEPYVALFMKLLERFMLAFSYGILALILNALINYGVSYYNRLPISRQWPIMSYVQFLKIFLFILFTILIVSALIDKSPAAFFTGLGAITAVLLLVFKDSIMSFVASIQLASSDIVRVGDWITIPGKGVDGDVLEMSLNTIKVQNFDKTIASVPPYSLTTNAIKNWRGMSVSGGRRIKRALPIDVTTIEALDEKSLEKYKSRFPSLAPYIEGHRDTLLKTGTNMSLYRQQVAEYLLKSPDFHTQNFTMMVRTLDPGEYGFPMEVYAFTTTTNWEAYENIQSALFEYMFALLPQFDLAAYQRGNAGKGPIALDEGLESGADDGHS